MIFGADPLLETADDFSVLYPFISYPIRNPLPQNCICLLAGGVIINGACL